MLSFAVGALLLAAVEGFDPMASGRHKGDSNLCNGDRTYQPDGESSLPAGVQPEVIRLVERYSKEFHLDYRLVLALIKQESNFDHEALSDRGAEGLMQMMPVTNAEVMADLEVDESHPFRGNIQTGIYYFSKLFDLFSGYTPDDQACFALAAYNAGPGRIYDAQELAAYIGDNPRSWSAVQSALPLLSKRFYSLHESIWPDGKPRCGYFGGWHQTVSYVENIMREYDLMRSATPSSPRQ